MATRTTHAAILKPEDVAKLLVQPVLEQSVAGQMLTTVSVTGKEYRVPTVVADPAAGWVAEGAEIPIDEGELDEIEVFPKKVAGLAVLSFELASDSNPEAARVIGDGLSRDIAKKIDTALFTSATTNGPAGLPSLTGIVTATAANMAAVVDTFIGVGYSIEANSASITSWVTHPDTAARISSLKKISGSNEPLLAQDISQAGKRTLFGVPILTSPRVAANVVWGVDKRFSQLIVWDGAKVENDKSVFFTSDRIAIRAKMRANFAFTYPESVAKITLPAP